MCTAAALRLAAAPTFALMAFLTGVLCGGASDMLCTAPDASPLSAIIGGMVPMYVLMSIFHLSPWLKLIATTPEVRNITWIR